MGANKPVAPASLLQVGGAGRVVGKKSLELWERLWEPKIATLVNVHEHGRTLPLVAVGDNRIGTASNSRGPSILSEHLYRLKHRHDVGGRGLAGEPSTAIHESVKMVCERTVAANTDRRKRI